MTPWKPILICLILFSAVLLAGCGDGETHGDSSAEVAATTLVHVGSTAPDFTITTLDGESFTLAEQRGKVVLINWWATWCPPCRAEIPHLEKEVWQRFSGAEFAMISISREETPLEVQAFMAKNTMTWPQAVDADRSIFALYAESYIPRNFVVDRDGKVVFQSQGYEPEEFAQMVRAISAALGDSSDSR